jgi:hypothetical protein
MEPWGVLRIILGVLWAIILAGVIVAYIRSRQ